VQTSEGSSQVVDEKVHVQVFLSVGFAAICLLEELFGEPVEGLFGI
jgi:hypothetical protein